MPDTFTSRADHLKWCKDRALAYLPSGDVDQAFASMVSDLNKHDETREHSAIKLGMMLKMGGHLKSVPEMRKFIDGFN